MGFVAVLQEQRTPIACTVMGIELLGSKVGFLLVLLVTPPILLWFSWNLQCSNSKRRKISFVSKIKKEIVIICNP
jgi:hypothetical protein